MAGAKGRSGGSNRKSEREHQLAGTFRSDRHGQRGAALVTAEPPAHLDASTAAVWREVSGRYRPDSDPVVIEVLAGNVRVYRRLYAVLVETQARAEAGGPPVDTSRLQRSLRQQSALIRALTSGLRLVDTPQPDSWLDEFENTN